MLFNKYNIFYISLSLTIAFVITGCGNKSAQDGVSTTTSFSADNAKTACEVPPVENVHTEFYESSLKNQRVENGYLVGDWDEDSYLCGKLSGDKASINAPELILVIGNQDGLSAYRSDLKRLLTRWIGAAAGSHRRGCIFMLSSKNLARLSERTNLQRVTILGHGASGNVLSTDSDQTISPEQIATFKAKNIKKVNFYSCQAGQKLSEWERVFGQSPNVHFDISRDDVSVTKAFDEVLEMVEDIWQCRA
jgi:hypothetical protein